MADGLADYGFRGDTLAAEDALEGAVVAALRHYVEGFGDTNCGVRGMGRPPAMAPDVFCAVWCAGGTQEYENQWLCRYSLNVTLSLKGTLVPDDRWAGTVRRAFDAYRNPILQVLHGGANAYANEVIGLANRIRRPEEAEFQSALVLKSLSSPAENAGDWWVGSMPDAHAGLAQTYSFSTWTLGGFGGEYVA